MKKFHFSDVLTITTGRLVSTRHVDGIYDVLNFMTGDELFTHQLPRAADECRPWLATQFPELMEESPAMKEMLDELDNRINPLKGDKQATEVAVTEFLDQVKEKFKLPEMIPVYELGADMHLHIDPVEELKAMVGDENVIVVEASEGESNKQFIEIGGNLLRLTLSILGIFICMLSLAFAGYNHDQLLKPFLQRNRSWRQSNENSFLREKDAIR